MTCLAGGLYAPSAAPAAELRAAEAPPSLDTLRHAVVCPPFKGDEDLAKLYHGEMVKLLQQTDHVEYLEGSRALAKNAPAFTYRLTGETFHEKNGAAFISITLTDAVRKEKLVSWISPISTNRSDIAAWRKTVQADMLRRVAAVPFECRIQRKFGQSSVSLDRGLSAGLRPGMRLYAVLAESPLISAETGEEVGRDTPRALGKIKIFRVNANTAYARPEPGTTLPRTGRLYVREF